MLRIVIDLPEHTSVEDAEQFAQEINETFQPHHDARVVKIAPADGWPIFDDNRD